MGMKEGIDKKSKKDELKKKTKGAETKENDNERMTGGREKQMTNRLDIHTL